MRLVALVLGLLAVGVLAAAAAIGFTPVETAVGTQDPSYDCGSAVARLGGDTKERTWSEDSFLFNTGNANIPPEQLPQAACKEKTDDRLDLVMILGPLGVVLLVGAAVLAWLGRPGRRATAPATERADEPDA